MPARVVVGVRVSAATNAALSAKRLAAPAGIACDHLLVVDDDAEKRIAELERQLAQQRRIAELERQLAEAKAAAGEDDAGGQPPPFFAQATGQDGTDEHARRYAQALFDGLRTGGRAGHDGPSGPEMTHLREALTHAAAAAGMSQEQVNDALQNARVTFKSQRSVVYPGQGDAQDFAAPPGVTRPISYPGVSGVRPTTAFPRQRAQRTFNWATLFGIFAGLIGACVGGVAALTAVAPSTMLWASPIVCRSPYHLDYSTSNYSYRPGQSGTSVSFQCVNGTDWYRVNEFALVGLQSLVVVLVLGVALGVGALVLRVVRKPKQSLY